MKIEEVRPWSWPPAHVQAMTRLIEVERLTASQTAAALNALFDASYTRMSVIGKARRLGVKLERNTGGGGQHKVKARLAPVPVVRAPQEPVRALPAYEPGEPVPFADLPATGCKWEVSGRVVPPGGHVFCGQQRVPGKPYCAHHLALAYVPGTRGKPKGAWRDGRGA